MKREIINIAIIWAIFGAAIAAFYKIDTSGVLRGVLIGTIIGLGWGGLWVSLLTINAVILTKYDDSQSQ